jgi:cysteine synthase A
MNSLSTPGVSGAAIASDVLDTIGNTPIVELRKVIPPHSGRVLVKLEYANPTGCMKDRMAKGLIEAAVAAGRVRPGDTVVEYTGGSTGVSLALVCAAKGYRLHAVYSDAFSDEKRRTMQAFGAQVTDVLSDRKMITEKLIREMIETARTLSNQPDHWWPDQLNNEDGIAGYYPLGEEIWNQTDGTVTAFVQAVGTAHSISGVTAALKHHKPELQIVAVEPAESAVLSGQESGAHQIEGIGIGFIPPLWDPKLPNEIMPVSTGEAMQMARRLAHEEGLFAGTSSGANVVAAARLAQRLGPGAVIVTLLIDSGLKYVSTDLFR